MRRLFVALGLAITMTACEDGGAGPADGSAPTTGDDSEVVSGDGGGAVEDDADSPVAMDDAAIVSPGSDGGDAAAELTDAAAGDGASEDAGQLMDATIAQDGAAGEGGLSAADAGADAGAGSNGDANTATGDAATGNDAGSPSPIVTPCLVTRSVADDTLLFAPGHSSSLALTASTVVGFQVPSSYGSYAGWSLWSRTNGTAVADSSYWGTDASDREAVLGTSGTAFLVITRNDLVLRGAADGQELWRLNVPAPAVILRGGVASDASYVWFLETSGGASTFKAYATPGGTTPFLSAASTANNVWAEASGPTVLTSDSTSTTLTRYPKSGSASVVGPVPGRLTASFGSQDYFITKASGGIVRVFAPTGAPPVATINQASDSEGGAGQLFWLYSSANQRVDVYKVSDTSQPLQSFNAIENAPTVLSDGFVLSDRRRIKIAGETLQVTTPPGDDWVKADFQGADVSIGSSGIHVTGLATSVGCGRVLATSADARRAYVSTTWAGTFIYEAPFRAPVGHVDVSGTIVTTRSGTRFAIVPPTDSSSTSVYVYEPTFAQVAVRPIPASGTISLNADGARLGLGFAVASTGVLDTVDGTWKVIRVSDGQELFSATHPYSSYNAAPRGAAPPTFSPSGNRIAIGGDSYKLPCGANCGYVWNTTYIHEGTTLLGTFPGNHGEWVDEEELLGSLAEGVSIVSAEGLRLTAFACASLYALQWKSETILQYPNWIQCDLPTNTSTPTSHPASFQGTLVGAFGSTIVTRAEVAEKPTMVRVY